ncbi:cation:proton antiporter [Campylobacter californiensis]|uniref:cation:proton antiporter n=1 Tax=Campylobacter californiensis TaxID=1032243 RepID=UPI001472BD47|nr:cation:proton antiporter [Campylobacter sp. RM12916]MBE3609683.1 cation:proton antiporter [Campylobacter sp. RM12916]
MQTDGTNELGILVTLAFIIFSSPYFSRILRIPIAPIEITLGAVVGYFGFIGENEIFKLISEVGFFFLMFLAGMEIDLRMLINADRKILKLGMIYISLLYIFSAILTFSFNLTPLFIIIIPLMAVGMIFTLFKEYGKDREWLNLSMLIAAIGELVSIVLLTFAAAYLQFGAGLELWVTISYLIIFLVLSVLGFKFLNVLFWWYPSIKLLLMPHYDKDEKDIRLSIAVFFVMIALMVYLHLEVAFGAFIAGMFITTFFDHKKDLPHKLASFGFGFLVPTFFVYIGSTFKLNNLFIPEVLNNAAFIVVSMIGCRLLASLVFLNILKLKNTVLYALSHSMPLTLLIAVATIAYKTGNIDKNFYSSFILASLTQAIISLISIKILINIKPKFKKDR